ncbi:response regulator [Sphingomonas crocodyli]|nr:response regulator [Sphingomonas crocodyli]
MKRDNSALIVEDSPILGPMIADMLEILGHDTTIVEGEQEAIANIRDREFSLLICDIKLGEGGSGLAVAAEARKRQPEARVIVVSGNDEPPDLPGGVSYLAKPFTLKQLGLVVGMG